MVNGKAAIWSIKLRWFICYVPDLLPAVLAARAASRCHSKESMRLCLPIGRRRADVRVLASTCANPPITTTLKHGSHSWTASQHRCSQGFIACTERKARPHSSPDFSAELRLAIRCLGKTLEEQLGSQQPCSLQRYMILDLCWVCCCLSLVHLTCLRPQRQHVCGGIRGRCWRVLDATHNSIHPAG